MPTYEYACRSCGEHLEVVQSFRDDALTDCPACGGALRKVFGSIGIAFKGSGFYKNDSRSSSGRAKAKADSAGKAETAGGSKADSGAKSDGSSASSSSGTGDGGSKSGGTSKDGAGSGSGSGNSATSPALKPLPKAAASS